MRQGLATFLRMTTAFFLGIVIGVVIYGFKWVTLFATVWNLTVLETMKDSWLFVMLVIVLLLGIAIILDKLLYEEPNAGGSSISRASTLIEQKIPIHPLKSALFTMISTFFVFLTGTPLGIEGPSIMIGTSIGAIKTKSSSPDSEQDLRSSGAGSAFTAVTGSPIASIFFVIEEMLEKPKMKTVWMVLFGSLGAFISLLGLERILNQQTTTFFHFEDLAIIPFSFSWIFLIIGVLGFFAGYLFNLQVTLFNRFFAIYLYRITRKARFFFTLLAILLVGLVYIDLLGSGHHPIIDQLFQHDYTLSYIAIILLLKIVFIALANAADLPGGMFVPVLVVGGLYGALFNELFILLGMNAFYTSTLIYVFMGTFFATSMKAPLTAIVFFIEASYFNPQSIYIILSVMIAFGLSKRIHYESINDLVIDSNKAQKLYNNAYTQVRLRIDSKSRIIGMAVKDLFNSDAIIVKGIIHTHTPNHTDLNIKDWRIIGGDEITLLCKLKPKILKKSLNQVMDHYELEIG